MNPRHQKKSQRFFSAIFPALGARQSSFVAMHKTRLPFAIWAISIAAFFLNFSSVIAFGCVPIFLIRVFGLHELDAGILEGTVEGFALVVRSLTGLMSDLIHRRKIFLVWGYGISMVARFLLAPSTLVHMVVASRFIEKLGNGLQASPREAFISDITPTTLLGRAYGLNKTFSMSGSFVGSFLMLLLFVFYKDFDIRLLFWISAVLSAASFIIITWGVEDPQDVQHAPSAQLRTWKQWGACIVQDLKDFSPIFWGTLGIVCIFKLGYFSGNFLMFELNNSGASFLGMSIHNNAGLSNSVFLVLQNLSCSLLAYPLGKLSDMIKRRYVVMIGFFLMIISLLCFVFYRYVGFSMLYAGIILYGLQMSLQGALLAFLSLTMPSHLHGTGFGIFFLMSGLCVIFTNQVLVRFVSLLYGRPISFLVIACCVTIGLGLMFLIPDQKKSISSEN